MGDPTSPYLQRTDSRLHVAWIRAAGVPETDTG